MSLDRNPWKPTRDNLEYFYQQVLLPKYDEDKLDKIDLGQGKSYELPSLTYEERTLKPDLTFERGGRTYRPQDMFLKQNATFKKYADKYKQRRIDRRIKTHAKTLPNLQFSLQEVELIKPRYGKSLEQ